MQLAGLVPGLSRMHWFGAGCSTYRSRVLGLLASSTLVARQHVREAEADVKRRAEADGGGGGQYEIQSQVPPRAHRPGTAGIVLLGPGGLALG